MHELSVAQGILEIVCEHVPQESRENVREVRVNVGVLSNIQVDSLTFGFDSLKTDYSLGSAKMVINNILLEIDCKNCDTISHYNELAFSCSNCGSFEIEILKGRELHVAEIDIDDEP